MPSDFHRIRYILPKFSKRDYAVLMKTLHNSLTFDLSNAAKFRLHVLDFYYQHGWKATIDAFSIGKSTLYDWKKMYEVSQKKLSSLIPGSTRPKRLRTMQTDYRLLELIKTMRQKYGSLSKYKLKPFLDALSRELDIPSLSVSVIGKIIKRNHYFYETKTKTKRRRKKTGSYLKRSPKQTKPGYCQMDSIHIWMLGRKYYFITIIDVFTKCAWCKLTTSLSSRQARLALQEFQKHYPHKIRIIQTDNGSEFLGEFQKYLEQEEIKHEFIYPRSPKINGIVERFNRTIKEEFIARHDEYLYDIPRFNQKLIKYLNWYNNQRPHYSLGYISPHEYLKNYKANFPKCG
jgi:transposase